MAVVSPAVARQVAQRAQYRCEYCHSPQSVTAQTFHIDHVYPLSQGGSSHLDNLCYACPRCNLRKANRTAATDPDTNRDVPLYHPRQQRWHEHFAWTDNYRRIRGLTLAGRATVALLDLNSETLMRAREMWVSLRLLS